MAPHGKKLTAAFVRTVQRPGLYWDEHGLVLRVKPSGYKQWIQRLFIHGKRRELGLGPVRLVTLAQARADGDPMASRRQSVPTFEQAAGQPLTSAPGPKGEVVDLFCGVGALSHGLRLSGFTIRAGYDLDARCKYSFEKNNGATFLTRDIATLTAREIRDHYSGNSLSVLAGCAPCQPFSTYRRRYEEDVRWRLVSVFGELATSVMTDVVTMENVPALLKFNDGRYLMTFVSVWNTSAILFTTR